MQVVVVALLRLGIPLLLTLRRFLLDHHFVADVVKSLDTVDRGVLDLVLSSLGLPGWFRHAYFEFHSHVRLRFKLAIGLGQPWTRDGGIPQGCPLSMMFIVALCLPWCRYLAAQAGVQPELYADNLKCVSLDSGVLLRAARFTTGYVRLVGQEPAPSKCVLMSTSRVVGGDMRGWVVSDEGHRWTVKLDVRDLGVHLETTLHLWSSTLAARVRLVIARLALIFALPLDFHGRLRVIRSMFIPGALRGTEASFLAGTSMRKLRAAIFRVVWSRRQSFASVGAVLSLLDGPSGCDPAYCVVWFRFRMLRRYLTYRPREVSRVYRLLGSAVEGCLGHGPAHLLIQSAAEIGFRWCARTGFRGSPWLDIDGTLQLLNSDHVRERNKALLRGILVGGVWNGFLLGKIRGQDVPCGFCGVVIMASACRGFCSVPGPLQTVQRAELWGVILALQASDGFHLGVDNLGVVRHVGRILDGRVSSRLCELLPDGDLLFLIERMLHFSWVQYGAYFQGQGSCG